MILNYTFKLDTTDVNQNMSSNFHGFLMSVLNKETASILHNYRYNPLRQRIFKENNEWFWNVVSLEKVLSEELEILLDALNFINLTHSNKTIKILEKSKQVINLSDFVKQAMNLEEEIKRYIHLEFISPTSFKSEKEHEIFPNIRKIIRSIMLNFDYFSEHTKIYDYEVLEYITENIKIVDYSLYSTKFGLEAIKIPAFKGKVTMKISLNPQMLKLVNLMFKFSELSGVGVKTSLGMGAIRLKI
ncbi:MAG: CRISPR system precrRNA processing endoribonuclease RAMP protein Cas6 [Defluviitaleaceae bacterium]|nr:CRISPR system precrRNA processing endoribonuclease RAMP protein Cas6 [Defluviitaleaceae bacterium]